VKPGGPADKAGMKVEDIILGLNGKPVKDGDDLVSRIADMPVGSQLTLNVDRDGKKMDFKVAVQDRAQVWADRVGPQTAPEPISKGETGPTSVKFGIYPRAASEEERELTPDKHGITVTRVEPGSFAEEIGMQERDIIVAINRQNVTSVDDIKKIQSTLKAGDAVAFRIVRQAPTGGARRTTSNVKPATLFLSGTLPEE
jgi:serine protease Do